MGDPYAFSDSPGVLRFADAILEAIGLKDQPIRSLEFRVAMEEPVVVKLELLLTEAQADALADAVSRPPEPDPA